MMRVMESRRLGRSRQEMVMPLRASEGLSQSDGCTSTLTLMVGGWCVGRWCVSVCGWFVGR